MKKMTLNRLLCGVIATVSLMSLGACSSESKDTTGVETQTPVESSMQYTEDEVKVGVLTSLTSYLASSERAMGAGIMLALDEINEAGGVLGRTVNYYVQDGMSRDDVFHTKAEELVKENGVAAIFGTWASSSRIAVKSVLEENNTLLFYPNQYEGYEDSKNILYTGTTANQQIVPGIDYLLEEGKKTFYLLGTDYHFPRTANAIITAQVEAAGGTIVGEEYVPLSVNSLNDILDDIQAKEPDVVINTINGVGNFVLFKQLAERGLDSSQVLTMSFSISEEDIVEIGTEHFTGHMVAGEYFHTTETAMSEAFMATYREAYGDERIISAAAVSGYASVYLWANACEEAGTFETDAVLEVIESGKVSFEGASGTFEFFGDSHHMNKVARVGVVEDDGLIYEVFSTDVLEPDPYLTGYDWADQVIVPEAPEFPVEDELEETEDQGEDAQESTEEDG